MLNQTVWHFPKGVPAVNPCFDGHFPGDPIVPGAYLLALAERRLAASGWRITGARRIKFLSPLRPDQAFQIEANAGRSGTVLRWVRDDVKIAEASVTLRALE